MRTPSETFIAVRTLFLLAAPAAADAPHVQIEMLDAGVANLAAQKILNSGHEKSLRTKLAHAAEALEKGDRDATVRRLDTFTHQVRALEGKMLPAKDAQFLAGSAATIRAGIHAVSTLPIGIDLSKFPLCQQTECKTSGQRFVDAASMSASPNGTVGNPFRTIAEAMESAGAEGLCRVEIVIAPGEYRETVTVDRNVMLRGSGDGVVIRGSILNPAGFGLEVENLALRDSPAPGAIVTPFTCSATVIRGVVIERATRSGILQNGGAIEIFRTAVRDTRSEPDDSTSGAGIY